MLCYCSLFTQLTQLTLSFRLPLSESVSLSLSLSLFRSASQDTLRVLVRTDARRYMNYMNRGYLAHVLDRVIGASGTSHSIVNQCMPLSEASKSA